MKPTDPAPTVPPQDQVLLEQLTGLIEDELAGFLEGAQDDLRALATRLSANAINAAASGRQDLVEEARDAARTLAEAQRLSAVDGGWDVFDGVVSTLFGTLLAIGRRA